MVKIGKFLLGSLINSSSLVNRNFQFMLCTIKEWNGDFTAKTGQFQPKNGRFPDLNLIYKIFGKKFCQNFVKKGQNWWKSAFWPIFFIWWLKLLKNTVHAKFELFITFRYPQNGHFYHAFLRKSKKFGRNWVKKGSKQVKKGGEAQNYWIHG